MMTRKQAIIKGIKKWRMIADQCESGVITHTKFGTKDCSLCNLYHVETRQAFICKPECPLDNCSMADSPYQMFIRSTFFIRQIQIEDSYRVPADDGSSWLYAMIIVDILEDALEQNTISINGDIIDNYSFAKEREKK